MAAIHSTRRSILSAMAIAPVVIAAPALATSHSRFEALRIEYNRIAHANGYADDDPVFLGICDRMTEIEQQIIKAPCSCKADAQAKLRFMNDLHSFGSIFDGDDAHEIVIDISRFLL